jgi:hypothetical protein
MNTKRKGTLLGVAAMLGLGLLAFGAQPAAAKNGKAWGHKKHGKHGKDYRYDNGSRYRNSNHRDGHWDAGGWHDTSDNRYRSRSRDGHYDFGGWHDTSDNYRYRNSDYRWRHSGNDIDGDGIPNNRDRDIDGDGHPNYRDHKPYGSGYDGRNQGRRYRRR